jgi:hypothetical protein
VTLLRQYAQAQRKNDRPYIAEAADPFTGSWEGHDTYYHSEHYFHSSYIDLVITGLVGLRPRADDTLEVNPQIPDSWNWLALEDVEYRGRKVSVYWDRDGSRYRRGAGLTLYVDGRRIAQSSAVARLVVHMGSARTVPSVDRMVNFAVNNGRGAFPFVTASYSAPQSPPHFVVDGHVWYHAVPPNRWTALGSGNTADTLALDFGIERPIEEVALYFLDDGDSIRAPESYRLERWTNGAWEEIPEQLRTPAEPRGRMANRIRFASPFQSSRLRVVMMHHAGSSSGLSEFESWAHATPPFSPATATSANLAFNADSMSFPRLTASFTSRFDKLRQANDGQVAYTRYSRNRWSAYGTTSTRDWIELDVGEPKRMRRFELHFVADGRGLVAPRSFTIERWDGSTWVPVPITRRDPAQPLAWAMNTAWTESFETSRVRVIFEHATPGATAVSELLVYGDEH